MEKSKSAVIQKMSCNGKNERVNDICLSLVSEIIDEIDLNENLPSDDFLYLLQESIMIHSAIYSKTAFLIATGKKSVSKEQEKIICKKEQELDFLNRYVQTIIEKKKRAI